MNATMASRIDTTQNGSVTNGNGTTRPASLGVGKRGGLTISTSAADLERTVISSAPGSAVEQRKRPAQIDHRRTASKNSNSNGRVAAKKPQLLRSKSDFSRNTEESQTVFNREISRWGARHGFEDHYQSEDIISQLASNWYMYFTDKRHQSNGKPKAPYVLQEWRMRDRLKTVSAAIAICLNIGVEPPDQLRTTPGAHLEAWQDPTAMVAQKALEAIGAQLQENYGTLSKRTRFKPYLDPSIEETKRFCISLRRSAKDERVLLHYNGHGVPKPTASGEIWVFNKNYTQYIPVSLFDLQQWLQAPTVFVWDCSEAGNILSNYHRFVEKHEQEEQDAAQADENYHKTNFRPYIHLAACSVKENLPTNPLVPADMFTCCLTTPIHMALWFFVQQNPLKTSLTPERARNMPGTLVDRRSPLGELNWIFTAITDTIAWTTLPRQLFRQFFRQDLVVAALFRNFLLAQRVMSVYNCHPQSYPELPDTRQHPLWASWDLAVDRALGQLPMLERREAEGIEYEFQSSSFFTDQLTAFEVYLTRGDAMEQKPPDQLPVVLQVLLSQKHRVRALILLGRFLDLGPWAVQLALSIGIFPYVLKLLQSAAAELKPVMVFLWARVLAVDSSCQQDLIKDSGYNYFASILKPSTESLPIVNTDEHRAMCAFILTMLCRNYRPGQTVCNQTDIMSFCLLHLHNEDNPLLRQWSCLCVSQLWKDLSEAKWRGIRENAPIKLAYLAKDPVCEVRTAMLHAMTTLLGIPELTDEVARMEESIAWTVLDMANDGSALVRKELLVFMSHFVLRYENKFLVTAFEHLQEEREYLLFPPGETGQTAKMGLHYVRPENRHRDGSVKDGAHGLSQNTVFAAYWKHILILSVDPHPEVQSHATVIVDYIHEALLRSPVGPKAQAVMAEIQKKHRYRQDIAGLRSGMGMNGGGGGGGGGSGSGSGNGHLHGSASSIGLSQGGGLSGMNGGLAGDGSALPSPGLLRRTVSTLFSPFFGSDYGQLGSGSSRPASSAASEPPASPNRGSLRGRPAAMGVGVGVGPGADAPPEDSEREQPMSPYNVAREPVSAGFEERATTATTATAAAATAAAVQNNNDASSSEPTLPLESTFLEWSTEYFREPQMRMMEAEEPGSTEYNERLWRRSRNEDMLQSTQPQKPYAGSHKWNNQLGMINNGSQPAKMAFHQFEDHLAVADDGNTIQVWDWKLHGRLSRFSNGNPVGSRISDLAFINEDDQALLMAGSSDGVLRVYRNYDTDKKVELATAWRALTDMVPSNVHAGMVFDWQQVTGNVLVAGDVRVVRVWNAGHEACVADIPARSGSCVTSLTSDQMTGNLFVAGFGDGAVRVFDTRLRPQEAMVRKWKTDDVHDRVWVKSVHMQRGGQRELLSAARDGKVRLWDIRADRPLRVMQTTTHTLRTASTHEHLPVFAVGTSARTVRVFNFDGRELSTLEPYSGFLQSRSAPISATAFHPHQMALGCAARGDYHINLYTCSEARAV